MPRRQRASLETVADVSDAQLGLITAAQLAEIGLARSSTNYRTRQGGPWLRVLPGVYLVSGRHLTPEQRRTAALLYVGDPAALTGCTALDLYGVAAARSLLSGDVHVLIPAARRRLSKSFVTVERTEAFPVPRMLAGHAVVSPARAAIDATRRVESRDAVRRLLTEVVHQRIATVGELRTELRAGQRRRSALARETLDLPAAGPSSVAEIQLFEKWRDARLPAALWNVELFTPSGDFIARPDVYLPRVGLAIELESQTHHLATEDWESTMRRRSRIQAWGIDVMQVTPRRVSVDWQTFADEVRRAVVARGRHPVPLVVVGRSSTVA